MTSTRPADRVAASPPPRARIAGTAKPAWLERDWPWPILGAALIGILLAFNGTWHGLELKTFDTLAVHTAPDEAALPITIIAVDEESMGAMGRQWPWPRGLYAGLLDRLKEAGVAVAAFDIVFSEPDRDPGEDAAFARAIKSFGRPVVLAANLEYRETTYARQWIRADPRPAFVEAGATVGLASVKNDDDGVLRNVPVSQGAFWLAVVTAFDKVNPSIARNLSVTASDRIRYLGGPQTFTTIPFHRMLDPEKLLSENWKDVLRDNIVLVGRVLKTTPELNMVENDMFFTPFFASTGQLTAGVETQATIVANMMAGETLREAPAAYSLFFVVAAAFLAWLAMGTWHPWKSGAWTLALAVLVVAVDAALFRYQRLWVPGTAALATLGLAYVGQGARGFLSEQARRQELRRAFAQYVSPALVDEILASPGTLKLGGDRREITLLFTDLVAFTSICEQLPAEEVARILNRHLAEMTEIVMRHGGTVNKFIGDAVMAFWGAPVADPAQADHALDAAIEMQAAMTKMRAELLASGGPTLGMRIGLHRGECIVGNLGGMHRFDYTAIGDSVNLAARLEGVNKVYGTGILASDGVAKTLAAGRSMRPVDSVRVMGRHQAVELFTPCDDRALAARASEALDDYRAGHWESALARWRAFAQSHPDDPIAKVFLARIEAWSASGWPDPWDGITELESK